MLHQPDGVAVDAAGNLFIADRRNHRVRRVSPEGVITTVAGGGEKAPLEADSGPATEARLTEPEDVALDGTGNLYIADSGHQRVRKVSADGIITTVAGKGKNIGSPADGVSATEARLDAPLHLAIDAAGNLFIAERDRNRVRMVGPDGIITTVAGGGEPADGLGDGGPAIAAQLYGPAGMAVDGAGNLFITEYGELSSTDEGNRVRKVTPDGIITTVAGTGEAGFSGDGGQATAAQLTKPFHVAVDAAGNLIISDWDNYRVRKVGTDGIIVTIAGNEKRTFSGAGGPATTAGLRGPTGLVVDAAGNLFLADSGAFKGDELGDDERILKVIAVAAPGLIAGQPFPKP
jgi:sugar lactone lactonase YvrE